LREGAPTLRKTKRAAVVQAITAAYIAPGSTAFDEPTDVVEEVVAQTPDGECEAVVNATKSRDETAKPPVEWIDMGPSWGPDPSEQAVVDAAAASGECVGRETQKKKRTKSVVSQMSTMTISFDALDQAATNMAAKYREDRARRAFDRFSSDAEINTERLLEALVIVGHRIPREDWVKEALLESSYEGVSFLSRKDFLAFVEQYTVIFQKNMKVVFDVADSDGTGALDFREVSRVLRDAGVMPVSHVVKELISEVTGSSHGGQARVNLEQFTRLYDIIGLRAGFTLKESAELSAVFTRYDHDKDGLINQQELEWCLRWMGFTTSKFIVSTLMRRVDVDEAGVIDEDEFFTLMRMHHDHEVDQVLRAFSKHDDDHDGQVPRNELSHVFEALGYAWVRPKVIEECVRRIGLQGDELYFEDIYLVLEAYRTAEGFLQEEMDEVQDVFRRFAKTNTSLVDNEEALALQPKLDEQPLELCVSPMSVTTVSKLELGGVRLRTAFRWLGYTETIDELQDSLEMFDLDQDASLDIFEFPKLLRTFNVNSVRKIREAFKQGDSDNDGDLNMRETRKVMIKLGFPVSAASSFEESSPKVTSGETEIRFWEFFDLIDAARVELREKMRKNQGFTDGELKRLRHQWKNKDLDGNGYIQSSQLASLIEELFPDARVDVREHAFAKAVLEIGDADHDGSINFEDFTKMMRILQDDDDVEKLNEEQSALSDCGYSRNEVAEFRKVFRTFDDDDSGQMSGDEVEAMFEGLVTLTAKASAELHKSLAALDKDQDRSLNFTEFLRLMRELQDKNWADINTTSADIATQEHSEQVLEDERRTKDLERGLCQSQELQQ
jgi:Ca2+-binding EF-hand superfamily protein